jgi:hypothetical protein
VESWILLVARMLALGYFPNSPVNNYLIGQCLQWQNAVLDGGFVDVDSLQPMRDVHDPRSFHETFLAMLVDLCATIRAFLVGPLPTPNNEYNDPTLVSAFLVIRVWDDLKRRLLEERSQGGFEDPRLDALVGSGPLFQELDAGLSALYPPREIMASPVLRHFANVVGL